MFNHALTPDALSEINQYLQQLFTDKELDTEQLKKLVVQRDQFIQAHLKQLADPDARAFAESELTINQKLTDLTKQHQADVLKQTASWLRGQKSVDKYKKSLKKYR